MRYYIEKKVDTLCSYVSYAPVKRLFKAGVVNYRHVKQHIGRVTFSLYVDDMESYKKAGGVCRSLNKELSFPIIEYPSFLWDHLSGIPLLHFPTDFDRHSSDHKFISIDISTREEELSVIAQELVSVNKKEGLSFVSSIYYDYQESKWIYLPEEESKKQFCKARSDFNRIADNNTNADFLTLMNRLLIPNLSIDSGIAILAKTNDYNVLSCALISVENWNHILASADSYQSLCLQTRMDLMELVDDYQLLYGNKSKRIYDIENEIKVRYGHNGYFDSICNILRNPTRVWTRDNLNKIKLKWFEAGFTASDDKWREFMDLYETINKKLDSEAVK